MARRTWTTVGMLAVTCAGWLALTAGCAGQPALSAAASESIRATFPQATIHEVKREKENGAELYEVELKQNGQETEVTISPDGVILEVETELSMTDLPKAVADAITKAAAGAKVEEIEREETRAVVRAGKVVKLDQPKISYQAEFRKNGKEVEIEVAADGTALETETDDD